jgi:hypothetical protein
VNSDIETNVTQQQVIASFNSKSDGIQLQLDELDEVLAKINKLTGLQSTERQVHLRLKN